MIAHDNSYNRWTAGDAALFFRDRESCAAAIEGIAADDALVERLSRAARARAAESFSWPAILTAYEREALALLGRKAEIRADVASPA